MTVRRLNRVEAQEFVQLKALMSVLTSNSNLTPDVLQQTIDSGVLCVAEEDDKLVGCATLCPYVSPTGRKASIEDVVVLPEYQGKGVGKSMVEFLLNAAREWAPLQLQLTSRPARVAANALYQRVGFKRKETNVYTFSVE